MNRRVIVLFIIGLLILAALGGLLFYLSGKQQEDMQDLQTTLQIRKVLDEAVISPAAAYDNNSIWYFNSEGRLFKSNTDGSNLSEYPLPSLPSGSLKQVLWPKAGSDFIAVANSSGQTAKYYYNSANKVFTNLANNIQWVDWLPDGKRIAYIWQSDDKKTQSLVVSNADGTVFKTVTPVFWPDLALKASPDGKTVLMYRTNIVGDVNKIY